MNTFTLNLRLGNDAMQTPEDIAEALRRAAGWLEDYGHDNVENGGSQTLIDQNGNHVGSWVVS